MKTLKNVFLIALIASMFGACVFDEFDYNKNLLKQRGKWNIDKNIIESYIDGVLDTTETIENDGKITFQKDMSGFFIDSSGEKENFFWEFNEDEDNLIITQDTTPITYEIFDYLENSQTLQAEIIFETSGIEIKTIHTLEISR